MNKAALLPRRWRAGCSARACAGVLETPPIVAHARGPAIAGEVGSRNLLPFLVAAKSLHRALGRGRVVVVDDGTLNGAEKALLALHLADPEILPPAPARQDGFPAGRGWETWLTAYDRRRGEYWFILDPMAVVPGPAARIVRAHAANRSFDAGPALAGLAAGGPGRPDPAALFAALGAPAAFPRDAAAFLFARETAPLALENSGEILGFGPGEQDTHAVAARAAIEALT